MSNQINSQCWSFRPGSSVPLSQQTGQPPRQRNAPQSGQSGRVAAGHKMDDNFIPPGNSSEGAPTIGQRDVNRQGQMPFKITKTVTQHVVEGLATFEQIEKFFTSDQPDFLVSPHLYCDRPDCVPCNDPKWKRSPNDLNVNGPFGYTVHFNRHAMAQGQR